MTFDGEAARPRIGTSRLRVEISTESKQADVAESPRPSSAATPTWRPSLPPRGRPQLHFDVPSVINPRSAQEGGQCDTTIKPMPLPVRPGQYVPPLSGKERPLPVNNSKKDARPKPYTLEVPAIAPHYLPNGRYPHRTIASSMLTYIRARGFLPMDRKPPRGPVFRACYSPGIF